jgi:four helix bundle protein
MKDFKKLKVWQKGMKIVELTCQLTDDFPNSEQFGLTHQCRKSAVSIPSNIAESSSRRSNRDRYRFVEIAYGSSFELETQVLVAQMRQYSSAELIERLLDEIDQEQKRLTKYLVQLDK